MEPFRPLSTSDQLAQYLRRQINEGTLSGTMPGIKQIVQSLGVNSVAATKAVQKLEREGFLVHQGDRRSRLIAKPSRTRSSSLKVGMLHYDANSEWNYEVLGIKQGLTNAGHSVVASPKSMLEIESDNRHIARLVGSVNADAWVIFSGSNRVLTWFSNQDLPAFALHGRIENLSIAGMGVHKSPAIASLVGKLVGLGHRRIVMLSREERRKPHLGVLEQFFIDQLAAHGIKTGQYNIPDWDDTPEGLGKVIHSLFKFTPPTAIIVGDPTIFHAVQLHLAQKGILAPGQVSLFCNDFEESFRWTRPDIAHIQWDLRPCIRRITQWAKHVADGVEDKKVSFIKAEFHEGGTIGPAPEATKPR